MNETRKNESVVGKTGDGDIGKRDIGLFQFPPKNGTRVKSVDVCMLK
jgi:hypothetical protein